MRMFTSKHRPTLCQAGVQALQLYDPSKRSNMTELYLVVYLLRRPSQRSECTFFMTGAEVRTFDSLGAAQAAEMKNQLKHAAAARHEGMVGTFLITFICMNVMILSPKTNTMFMSFSNDSLQLGPLDWKNWMEMRLNEGILSKECQKLAWPVHKVKCKIQQCGTGDEPGVADCLSALRKFTSKHRPTLGLAGMQALELYDTSKHSNMTDRVLVIFVQQRPSQRSEFAFFMTGADVVSFELLGATFGASKVAEMKDQLQRANAAQGKGTVGTYFVVLLCLNITTGSPVSNIVPVSLASDSLARVPMEWKEWTKKRLNEGIVV
ncbi:hypothetical protein EIP86_007240 [Pleurotus ostreatoroseus]|nr:hypothetical protein EIP86_007240 [Pleurotus ostreatoroseus]